MTKEELQRRLHDLDADNKAKTDRIAALSLEVEYLKKLVESLRNPKPSGPKI